MTAVTLVHVQWLWHWRQEMEAPIRNYWKGLLPFVPMDSVLVLKLCEYLVKKKSYKLKKKKVHLSKMHSHPKVNFSVWEIPCIQIFLNLKLNLKEKVNTWGNENHCNVQSGVWRRFSYLLWTSSMVFSLHSLAREIFFHSNFIFLNAFRFFPLPFC